MNKQAAKSGFIKIYDNYLILNIHYRILNPALPGDVSSYWYIQYINQWYWEGKST